MTYYSSSTTIKAETLNADIQDLSVAELDKYIVWAEDIIDSIVTRVTPHADNNTGRVFPRICDDGIPLPIKKSTRKIVEILFLKKMNTASELQGAGGIKSESVSASGYSYTKGDMVLPSMDMYITPEIKAILTPYILHLTSHPIC